MLFRSRDAHAERMEEVPVAALAAPIDEARAHEFVDEFTKLPWHAPNGITMILSERLEWSALSTGLLFTNGAAGPFRRVELLWQRQSGPSCAKRRLPCV